MERMDITASPIVPVRPFPADVKPNHTIYINNLNEKVKKDELKKALYAIFSQFGEIVDIMNFTSLRMRGQAHVIFKDVGAACKAVQSMQGFPFHDKPMRIQFAREDSDSIAKIKGTYVPRPKKTHPRPVQKKRKVVKPAVAANPALPGDTTTVPQAPPNKILFCTNLPQETTQEMLRLLFSQFPNLREIRMIPNRVDIAFVEFDDEESATVAKRSLHNFKITPNTCMNLQYANK